MQQIHTSLSTAVTLTGVRKHTDERSETPGNPGCSPLLQEEQASRRAAALLSGDGGVRDPRLVSLEPGMVRLATERQERRRRGQTSAWAPGVCTHGLRRHVLCGQQQRHRGSAPETLGSWEAHHPLLRGCVLCSLMRAEQSWVGNSSPCSRRV